MIQTAPTDWRAPPRMRKDAPNEEGRGGDSTEDKPQHRVHQTAIAD